MKKHVDLLLYDIAEIATPIGEAPKVGVELGKLKVIRNGGIAIDGGVIVGVGDSDSIRRMFKGDEEIPLENSSVVPGFVDCHTHLIFDGSRVDELELKISGVSYLEIARMGGGIAKTVRATRKASCDRLVKLALKRLNRMLEYGSTTVEAKSGYGLNFEDEVKILEAIRLADERHPIDLIPTFLGAHAFPWDMKRSEYLELLLDRLLPETVGLARFCDVFCEVDFYTLEEARRILGRAKELGFNLKIHADEFTDLGGAKLAADLDAVSADHLVHSNDEGLMAMAARGVVGVLLPASSLSLLKNEFADARHMIDLGVPIALATDFNPNCMTENMQLIIALACYCLRMTPAEALTAATLNAACAINRGGHIGSIECGKKADIVVIEEPSYKYIPYHFGVNLVCMVIKDGKIVFGR